MTKKKKNSSAVGLNQRDVKLSRQPNRPVEDAEASSEASSIDETKPANRTHKIDCAEAIHQAKQRLREAQKYNDRPLARLAHVEAELAYRSQALQALSAPKENRPDKDLLIYQLAHSVNTGRTSRTIASKIRRDTLSLFSALDSSDPIESILDRHIVAMSNSAMECQARAAITGNPQARDINLRHAAKIARVLIDLIEARERRRRPKQVVVGNVNVEAGGQAIVGTVEAHKPRRPSEDDSMTAARRCKDVSHS